MSVTYLIKTYDLTKSWSPILPGVLPRDFIKSQTLKTAYYGLPYGGRDLFDKIGVGS
jgi:hypothetical protein